MIVFDCNHAQSQSALSKCNTVDHRTLGQDTGPQNTGAKHWSKILDHIALGQDTGIVNQI